MSIDLKRNLNNSELLLLRDVVRPEEELEEI